MKSALSWIVDPYIHVFLVAMLLVYLSMGGTGSNESEAVSKPTGCSVCSNSEYGTTVCRHLLTRDVASLR